jgi:hypothetical protein
MQAACSSSSFITVTNKANYIWIIQCDRPQQRSKIYGKLPTNNDHSLGLLPHHGRNAHASEHIATKERDLWSPSIARTWHEMGTIVSWHKIGSSNLEEAHRTTDGYNCVSWKQGSLLFCHRYNCNHLKEQSIRCGRKEFSSWLGQRLSSCNLVQCGRVIWVALVLGCVHPSRDLRRA